MIQRSTLQRQKGTSSQALEIKQQIIQENTTLKETLLQTLEKIANYREKYITTLKKINSVKGYNNQRKYEENMSKRTKVTMYTHAYETNEALLDVAALMLMAHCTCLFAHQTPSEVNCRLPY